MKKAFVLAALGALAIGVQAQPYSSWGKYREITVNTTATGASVNTAQAGYPLLVRLSNAHDSTGAVVLSEALAGGADVRFTDSTGNVALPYEIDSWTGTASANIWVRVPSVRANSTTKIRIYWSRAGRLTASNGPGVFSATNGYVGVWHLGNQTGATATAARPNSKSPGVNDALPVNIIANPVPGLIGNADTLAGGQAAAGQHLAFGTLDASIFPTAATLSLWVKAPSLVAGFLQYMTIGNTSGGVNSGGTGANAMWLGKNGTATNRLSSQNITEGDNTLRTEPTGTAANNTALIDTWQLLSMTVDGGNHALYSQGVLSASRADGQPLGQALREANYIGRATWNDPTFVGQVDEARVSNVARAADWQKLDFETQKAGSNVVKFGAVQTQPAPSAPTAVTYTVDSAVYTINVAITPNVPTVTNGADSFTVSGTLPAGIAFNTQTGVFSGTPTAVTTGAVSLTVTARNVTGAAPAKVVKITVLPALPGAPGVPTAAYGANTTVVGVSWTAPTSTGGVAITGYKARAVQDTSKTCSTTTALTCNITGLNGQTPYSFEVSASNSAGFGAYSPASNTLTPPTVPGVAPAVSASVGAAIGSITVYWNTAPSGGSPVLSYKVTAVEDTSKWCGLVMPQTSLQCNVHGLTAGQAYTFQVRAINAVGAGNRSTVISNSIVAPATGTAINPGSMVIRVNGSSKPFTFALPQGASADEMTMVINDVWGRTVWSKTMTPSAQMREVTWNGKNMNGRSVAAGMYIVKVSMRVNGKTLEVADKAVTLKP